MANKLSELLDKMPTKARENARSRMRSMAAELILVELRKTFDVSQEELARALNVDEAKVCEIGHRQDMLLSALAAYVQAMGRRSRDRRALSRTCRRQTDNDPAEAVRRAGYAGTRRVTIGGFAARPAFAYGPVMRANRDQILKTLSEHHHELVRRFGVKHLAQFGSTARDELRDDSDVDVLVEYEGPVTYDGYFKLQDYLQALLGRPVDLLTKRGLKPRARRHVKKDLVPVIKET